MTHPVFSDLYIPVRRKILVSYYHGGDQAYYDAFSRTFSGTYDAVFDNSLERKVDSDDPEYVLRRIRENYITGSSCTIVLIGGETWGRKYVDWEIDATLQRQHGLIGIRLPTAPVTAANTVIVPDRLHDNVQSSYALWVSWDQLTNPQLLTNWIEQANAKPKDLIVNGRERRYRNA